MLDQPIGRLAALALVTEARDDAERAIHDHPPITAATYESAKSHFTAGLDGGMAAGTMPFVGLSQGETRLVMNYLLATAFMSAWWDLHRDRARRDRAAQTAALLVTSLGVDPRDALTRIVAIEGTFKHALRDAGLGPRHRFPRALLAILVLGAAAYLLFTR